MFFLIHCFPYRKRPPLGSFKKGAVLSTFLPPRGHPVQVGTLLSGLNPVLQTAHLSDGPSQLTLHPAGVQRWQGWSQLAVSLPAQPPRAMAWDLRDWAGTRDAGHQWAGPPSKRSPQETSDCWRLYCYLVFRSLPYLLISSSPGMEAHGFRRESSVDTLIRHFIF